MFIGWLKRKFQIAKTWLSVFRSNRELERSFNPRMVRVNWPFYAIISAVLALVVLFVASRSFIGAAKGKSEGQPALKAEIVPPPPAVTPPSATPSAMPEAPKAPATEPREVRTSVAEQPSRAKAAESVATKLPPRESELETFGMESVAQKHCPEDAVVWLNPRTGIVHSKGQRWYKKTRDGVFACQKEAIQFGKKPASR